MKSTANPLPLRWFLAGAVTAVIPFTALLLVRSPSHAPRATPDSELRLDLVTTRLSAEFARQQQQLDELASSIRAALSRSPVNEASSEQSRAALAEACQKLETLVERLHSQVGGSVSELAGGGPLRQELEASIFERLCQIRVHDEFIEARANLETQLSQQHRLWTVADLLSRYGRPDRVQADPESLQLGYGIQSVDASTSGELVFRVREQVVIGVSLNVER